MNNLISFEFTENDDDSFTRDPEYQQISVHMVFDVKLTGLVRKARLCADGHKVDEVAREHTYSSVPSRDSVRMFFLLAALNDLDVLAADIQNAYLSAPIKEKYYIIATAKNDFSNYSVKIFGSGLVTEHNRASLRKVDPRSVLSGQK